MQGIEGIPEGLKLEGHRVPVKGEYYLRTGEIRKASAGHAASEYVVSVLPGYMADCNIMDYTFRVSLIPEDLPTPPSGGDWLDFAFGILLPQLKCSARHESKSEQITAPGQISRKVVRVDGVDLQVKPAGEIPDLLRVPRGSGPEVVANHITERMGRIAADLNRHERIVTTDNFMPNSAGDKIWSAEKREMGGVAMRLLSDRDTDGGRVFRMDVLFTPVPSATENVPALEAACS